MKPLQVFLFASATLLILLGISFLFPRNELKIGSVSFIFPKPNSFFRLADSTQKDTLKDDITKELNLLDSLKIISPTANIIPLVDTSNNNDTLSTTDSLPQSHPIIVHPETLKGTVIPIEWRSETDKTKLHHFFKNLLKHNKLWHILHYGDSQIESDRITAFLRYHLQSKFGGCGQGLVPPVNFVNSFSIRQDHSDNWTRYSIMKKSSYPFDHGNYGILVSFARFLPYHYSKNEVTNAWLSFRVARNSYPNTHQLKEFSLFYGQNEKTVLLQVFANDKLVDFKTLNPTDLGSYKTTLPKYTKNIMLKFVGSDSPDIYAVSFDDKTGVAVDNIPIRGASGTFFTKLNFEHLKKSLNSINVGAIFLEFGGNVLPYISDSAEAQRYGRYFASQINRLKRAVPGVPIIVLGVADMSVKSGTQFITYPLLETVRDALKKAAFSTGSGYWDMYHAMGGKNSMPSWVDAHLAIKDYTHFTGKGASVIAHMLYNAIMKEYNDYIKTK